MTGGQNNMILKCDRNPADASKNISRYTAFGSALNTEAGAPNSGAYANFKVNSSEVSAAPTVTTVTTTQKAIVADKTGTTEVTATDKATLDKANGKKEETVTKTTKVSKKAKKANH
ncbi:hypothetical protein RF55_7499 [Lasius niger]|uniref:Uncharacterized protein n=1 Tax=Lasius niger TaxID=67767 RepID=A0A0J7NJ09_LASNI|nr:hypothetical protein RF55_7499 [Lasius niger]